MRLPLICHRHRAFAAIGLLAAVLALISQIASGAVMGPGEASNARSTLAAVSVLCVGTPAGGPGGTRHHPRAPGCALCPFDVALASPAYVLTPAVVLPRLPPAITMRIAAPPPARGPPPPTARVGKPRAPPVQA